MFLFNFSPLYLLLKCHFVITKHSFTFYHVSYASTVLAVIMCPSVCPSEVGLYKDG